MSSRDLTSFSLNEKILGNHLLFDISDRRQLRAITFEKRDIEKLGNCGANGVDWFAGPSAIKSQDIGAS